MQTKPLLKKGLLLKNRICSQGEQILFFKKRPLSKREAQIMTELPPLKVYTFPLISLPGLHAGKHKNLQCSGVVVTLEAHFIFIAPACSRVRYRCPIFRQSVCPSVRLSTFMSTFDIYVKVSILINYKTKQPSNLAWNISLTSWLCDIGVRFSICLSIRLSVCQHLCRSSTFMSKLVF